MSIEVVSTLIVEDLWCLDIVQKEVEAVSIGEIAIVDQKMVLYDGVRVEKSWVELAPLLLLLPNLIASSGF